MRADQLTSWPAGFSDSGAHSINSAALTASPIVRDARRRTVDFGARGVGDDRHPLDNDLLIGTVAGSRLGFSVEVRGVARMICEMHEKLPAPLRPVTCENQPVETSLCKGGAKVQLAGQIHLPPQPFGTAG
jgi:hypothetical protein